jgi:hypothetical protein
MRGPNRGAGTPSGQGDALITAGFLFLHNSLRQAPEGPAQTTSELVGGAQCNDPLPRISRGWANEERCCSESGFASSARAPAVPCEEAVKANLFTQKEDT